MEIDPRIRLPFHDPDEAEQSYVGAAEPSGDAQLRHLQRVPLFSGFNEDELRRVAEHSRIFDAPAGIVITQIGDAGGSFFIIIDGTAAVRTRGLFWRDGLVDGEPRSATIVATTDLRLLVVDRSDFWRLLDETPELIRRILTNLSRRVRRLEQTIRAILQGPNPA